MAREVSWKSSTRHRSTVVRAQHQLLPSQFARLLLRSVIRLLPCSAFRDPHPLSVDIRTKLEAHSGSPSVLVGRTLAVQHQSASPKSQLSSPLAQVQLSSALVDIRTLTTRLAHLQPKISPRQLVKLRLRPPYPSLRLSGLLPSISLLTNPNLAAQNLLSSPSSSPTPSSNPSGDDLSSSASSCSSGVTGTQRSPNETGRRDE